MITRKQLMRGEVSHREYYAQYVQPAVLATVERQIGLQAILNSTDDHMNDIPLSKWDHLVGISTAENHAMMKERGTFFSLSDLVCIGKEAARQIQEAHA